MRQNATEQVVAPSLPRAPAVGAGVVVGARVGAGVVGAGVGARVVGAGVVGAGVVGAGVGAGVVGAGVGARVVGTGVVGEVVGDGVGQFSTSSTCVTPHDVASHGVL